MYLKLNNLFNIIDIKKYLNSRLFVNELTQYKIY